MKRLAQLMVLFMWVWATHGQGTILFRNVEREWAAPIRNATGELVPPDSGYFAALTYYPEGESLPFISEPTSFTTPGYFGVDDPPRMLWGLAAGSHPRLEVTCYRFMPGIWPADNDVPVLEEGSSGAFQLVAGLGEETGADAPPLYGMPPFQLRLRVYLSVGVKAGNVVVRWDADRRLPLHLQRASAMDASWQILTNAVSPHVEPVDLESQVFFRVVALSPWLQANQSVEATQPTLDVSDAQ